MKRELKKKKKHRYDSRFLTRPNRRAGFFRTQEHKFAELIHTKQDIRGVG